MASASVPSAPNSPIVNNGPLTSFVTRSAGPQHTGSSRALGFSSPDDAEHGYFPLDSRIDGTYKANYRPADSVLESTNFEQEYSNSIDVELYPSVKSASTGIQRARLNDGVARGLADDSAEGGPPSELTHARITKIAVSSAKTLFQDLPDEGANSKAEHHEVSYLRS